MGIINLSLAMNMCMFYFYICTCESINILKQIFLILWCLVWDLFLALELTPKRSYTVSSKGGSEDGYVSLLSLKSLLGFIWLKFLTPIRDWGGVLFWVFLILIKSISNKDQMIQHHCLDMCLYNTQWETLVFDPEYKLWSQGWTHVLHNIPLYSLYSQWDKGGYPV